MSWLNWWEYGVVLGHGMKSAAMIISPRITTVELLANLTVILIGNGRRPVRSKMTTLHRILIWNWVGHRHHQMSLPRRDPREHSQTNLD